MVRWERLARNLPALALLLAIIVATACAPAAGPAATPTAAATPSQPAPTAAGAAPTAAASGSAPTTAPALATTPVADLQSAGKTEKSTGNLALVVRKDVWDSGAIRGPQDLLGRTIYVQAGVGSGPHLVASRWLMRNGIDPRRLDWSPMNYPEVYAAMQNQGIEVGFSTEPLVTTGIERGVHQILATQEEMYPTTSRLYAVFSTGIDRVGPQVGERFMVAYLRAARAYINAFEYGVDEDAIIDILTQETPLKDAATYRKIKYSWVDPNGVVSRATLESDAQLFEDLGLINGSVDLSGVFNDKYRDFAVQYLGEYRPPR